MILNLSMRILPDHGPAYPCGETLATAIYIPWASFPLSSENTVSAFAHPNRFKDNSLLPFKSKILNSTIPLHGTIREKHGRTPLIKRSLNSPKSKAWFLFFKPVPIVRLKQKKPIKIPPLLRNASTPTSRCAGMYRKVLRRQQ